MEQDEAHASAAPSQMIENVSDIGPHSDGNPDMAEPIGTRGIPTVARPPVMLGINEITTDVRVDELTVSDRRGHLKTVKVRAEEIYAIDKANHCLVISHYGYIQRKIVLDFEPISMCVGEQCVFVASHDAIYKVRITDSSPAVTRELERIASDICCLDYFQGCVYAWTKGGGIKMFTVVETSFGTRLQPYDNGHRLLKLFDGVTIGAFMDFRVGEVVSDMKVTKKYVIVCDSDDEHARAYVFNRCGMMNFILRPAVNNTVRDERVNRGLALLGNYVYLSDNDKIYVFDLRDPACPHKFTIDLPADLRIDGLQILGDGVIMAYCQEKVHYFRVDISHLPGCSGFENFGYYSPEFSWFDPSTPRIPSGTSVECGILSCR